MKLLLSLLFITSGLLLAPGMSRIRQAHAASSTRLTVADRYTAQVAAVLAGKSRPSALRWLSRQRSVQRADLGTDGKTIDIHFKSGAEAAIFEGLPSLSVAHPGKFASLLSRSRTPDKGQRAAQSAGNNHAIVMEPFANELNLGPNAGLPEVGTLSKAGFQVDLLRNADVTVEVMQRLASYSVVYMETHSGALDNGDAAIMTGTTNNDAYTSLYAEHSLIQGLVAGDPTGKLYNGIRAKFVSDHTGTFPNSALVFINGCSVLGASAFWTALHDKNVATLISWTGETNSALTEQDAQFVLDRMGQGDSVQTALATAISAGFGSSVYQNTVVKLAFLGAPDITLAKALAGTVPAPIAKPPVKVKPHKKTLHCKRGYHRVKNKCKLKPKHKH